MKMKKESNMSESALKTAAIRTCLRALPMIASLLALNATAAVQVVRFNPPLSINTFSEPPAGAALANVRAVDFNVDGDVDYRLAYAYGFMEAYFNSPTRFGRSGLPSGEPFVGGPVAAVPLGSIIGSNIVSSVPTNYYGWSEGYTNRDDLTQPLGDHEAGVIVAGLIPGVVPGPIISISADGTNGTMVTNYYYGGPVVSGDVARKEAVMALEFHINGQPHYGYIHFDFRPLTDAPLGGSGGFIYGWAYETEPGAPIKAVPLSPESNRSDLKQRPDRAEPRGRGRALP